MTYELTHWHLLSTCPTTGSHLLTVMLWHCLLNLKTDLQNHSLDF